MKSHPRIRKTVKWGGAVLTVLFLTIWISSRWWYLDYLSRGGTWTVGVSEGTVSIGQVTPSGWPNPPPPWYYGFLDPPLHLAWWFDWGSLPPSDWWFFVPLWVPAAATLLATGAAWRLDALARRRARAGCCAKCGYDLTGNTTGICPECGAAAPQPRPVDGTPA